MIDQALRDLKSGNFGVAYVDPPWSWKSYAGKGAAPHRTAEAPYEVMDLDALKALPVADVMAKNSVLIMWVIGSHIEQALELGRAWGFTYSTDLFYWVKSGKNDPEVRPIGMGKWTRKQVEPCLIFTRGKPHRHDAGIRQLLEVDEQVVIAPRREHSRKPEEFYELIEKLVPGPYLEMFARSSRQNWTSIGDESGKFDNEELQLHDILFGTEGEDMLNMIG